MAAIVEKGFKALLESYSSITDLVSTRIYYDHLPQTPTLPALVYSLVTDTRETTTDGDSGPGIARILVDCWAEDKATARALADAVIGDGPGANAGCAGYVGTIGGVTFQGIFFDSLGSVFEEHQTLRLWREMVDFTCAYAL